jgi:hypothetical protein
MISHNDTTVIIIIKSLISTASFFFSAKLLFGFHFVIGISFANFRPMADSRAAAAAAVT